jgi:hypothetical protein
MGADHKLAEAAGDRLTALAAGGLAHLLCLTTDDERILVNPLAVFRYLLVSPPT